MEYPAAPLIWYGPKLRVLEVFKNLPEQVEKVKWHRQQAVGFAGTKWRGEEHRIRRQSAVQYDQEVHATVKPWVVENYDC